MSESITKDLGDGIVATMEKEQMTLRDPNEGMTIVLTKKEMAELAMWACDHIFIRQTVYELFKPGPTNLDLD